MDNKNEYIRDAFINVSRSGWMWQRLLVGETTKLDDLFNLSYILDVL